jgi:AMP-binding enzyme C-terminal domain
MSAPGWIYTGDRFARDADGFHFFRGRVDDLIKISGQWVYPLEVELCLADHPMVRECAVLAINGVDGLKTLKAFVVLNIGSTDLRRPRCSFRTQKGWLLPHKYPRIVTYVSELPKTGSSTGNLCSRADNAAEPAHPPINRPGGLRGFGVALLAILHPAEGRWLAFPTVLKARCIGASCRINGDRAPIEHEANPNGQ